MRFSFDKLFPVLSAILITLTVLLLLNLLGEFNPIQVIFKDFGGVDFVSLTDLNLAVK